MCIRDSFKAHPSRNRFIGQVGSNEIEQSYWGRPEDMTLKRPVYQIDEKNPGSDLAAETAASLAASFLLFRDEGDLMHALDCLVHARKLYKFAMENRGLYNDAIPDVKYFYKSSSYRDELALASLWLYRATGESTYKDNFLREFDNQAISENPGQFTWDNKWYAVQILARQLNITPKNYLSNFKVFLKQPKKTPKGLFFVQKYGSLRHAANLAFLAQVAATIEIENKSFFNGFAVSQINYILGDGGRSYVVGFGNNPPQRPFHQSSSCPSNGTCGIQQRMTNAPNPHILYGALVGGPDHKDQFTDNRNDYIKNEVACDFNAGFQSAVAGLIQLQHGEEC